MKRPLLWLGLSLIVAMGSWVRPLPAQQPITPVPTPVPATLAAGVGCASCAANQANGQPQGRHGAVFQWFQRHGYGCGADPDMSCASPCQDWRFVFGSCRSFFGETCNPLPPHPAPQAP